MRNFLNYDWNKEEENINMMKSNTSEGGILPPLSCTSSSCSNSQEEDSSDEDTQKICFNMDELTSRGGEKYLSLLSAADFKIIKGEKSDRSCFQSMEEIKSYPLEEGMDETKPTYAVDSKQVRRLLTFEHDSSFCFIKYKPYHEFNEEKRIKIKKYKEKEKKKQKKKIDIRFMPLYISIVGGLDVFLFKYYQHICDTYVNSYFYLNTYYFEKYVRTKYGEKKHSEQHLIHDPFYYHYLFFNKFGCHDSARAVQGARVGPHAYVKFFNRRGGKEANMVSSCVMGAQHMDAARMHLADISHMRMKEEVVPEDVATEEVVPEDVATEEVATEEVAPEELTREKVPHEVGNKIRSVVDKRSKQSSNEVVRKTSKGSSDEKKKKKKKITNEPHNCENDITEKKDHQCKQFEQNFFYAENELSTDEGEEDRVPKEPKEIHIFKRHLFILEYLKGYFSFSIFTRMENMISDMFENYLLNLPYVNRYVLASSGGGGGADEGVAGDGSVADVEYQVLPAKGAVRGANHFTSSQCFAPDNASYHALVRECFLGAGGVQLSMTVVNVEYWKFEDMKEEDPLMKKLMPDTLSAYFHTINKIYQKKNTDKQLVFLFNLCSLDLTVDDHLFTLSLTEGLVYLFLNTLEMRTMDLYKENLQSEQFDTSKGMYNFDFIFISSTYKSRESKTIHIIVNERIVLYDFHLVKKSEEVSTCKGRKSSRVAAPRGAVTTLRERVPSKEEARTKASSLMETYRLQSDVQQIDVRQRDSHQRDAHQRDAHQRDAHQRDAHQRDAHQRDAHQGRGESITQTDDKHCVNESAEGDALLELEQSHIKKRTNGTGSESILRAAQAATTLSPPKGDTQKEGQNKICDMVDVKTKHMDGNTHAADLRRDLQNAQLVEPVTRKNISTENVYYNLNFLKEYQENEIKKFRSKKMLDDVDVKLFFTEEYLIKKTNLPDRFVRETLKKLARRKLLQRNTFKVMNKRNNKTTQFIVYTTSELDAVGDTDVCERRVKEEEVESWEKVPEGGVAGGCSPLLQLRDTGEMRTAQGEQLENDKEPQPQVRLPRRQGGTTRPAARQRSEQLTRQRSSRQRANTPDPTPKTDRRRKLPIAPSDLSAQNSDEGKLQLAKKQKCARGKSARGEAAAPQESPQPQSASSPPSVSSPPSALPPTSASSPPSAPLPTPSPPVVKIKTEGATTASREPVAGEATSNGQIKKEKDTRPVSSSVVKLETSSMASCMNNALGTCGPNEEIAKRESAAAFIANDTCAATTTSSGVKKESSRGGGSTVQGPGAESSTGRRRRAGARSGNRGRTCKGGQEKAPDMNHPDDKKKRTRGKRGNKYAKEKRVANNLVSYLSESKGSSDGTVKDHSGVKQGEATNPAGSSFNCSSSMNEPVDFFLDDVVTDNDEEKEIKKRKTFDNLNLEEPYEFYQNHILKITTDRMNKMKAEPGRNTSTPLFLIVSSLNRILTEKGMSNLSQPSVLAILNMMMKKNKVVRVGGNWQPT
ncbi:hypothetical protein AK88_00357 [Plasmodium fragile]|uniref:Uncharacterized protein n=1 Tax=Plasmodium fragile TaxID=5857 RepID=A0A0D9QU72_PLAFR|nr:uncharacterized protein AK88_00357 [Plasmodium fragile]KJP89901.1 hypothetical protein AK88_00357 [Plasmodium fragile]